MPDTIIVPTIPKKRLTAKHSNVPTNVATKTRTRTPYQRGARGPNPLFTFLTYTIPERTGHCARSSLNLDFRRLASSPTCPHDLKTPGRVTKPPTAPWCIKDR